MPTPAHRQARARGIFRYPGSKARLLPQIIRLLWLRKATTYIEPFVGGGSVALAVAAANPQIRLILNDLDPLIASFWRVVATGRDGDFRKLIRLIEATRPSVDLFRRLKTRPGKTSIERAFSALYINRTAFGGVMHNGSGPVGGYNQNGKENVGRYWNTPNLVEATRKARALLHERTTVLNDDFEKLISLADENSFVYCDPPYYAKDGRQYVSIWTDTDHQRLARALKECRSPWRLSYDVHSNIIRLIAGERKGQYPVGGIIASTSYSIRSKKKHREVLYFYSPDCVKHPNEPKFFR